MPSPEFLPCLDSCRPVSLLFPFQFPLHHLLSLLPTGFVPPPPSSSQQHRYIKKNIVIYRSCHPIPFICLVARAVLYRELMMMEEEKRGLDLKFPRPSLSLVVLALCWGAQHCGDTLCCLVLSLRCVLCLVKTRECWRPWRRYGCFRGGKEARGILVCVAPAGHTCIVWSRALETFCSSKSWRSVPLWL